VAKKKSTSVNFEDAINELENIVESMEQNDISLEESLSSFERGIELTRNLQKILVTAEQKIQKLNQAGKLEPMEPPASD